MTQDATLRQTGMIEPESPRELAAALAIRVMRQRVRRLNRKMATEKGAPHVRRRRMRAAIAAAKTYSAALNFGLSQLAYWPLADLAAYDPCYPEVLLGMGGILTHQPERAARIVAANPPAPWFAPIEHLSFGDAP